MKIIDLFTDKETNIIITHGVERVRDLEKNKIKKKKKKKK